MISNFRWYRRWRGGRWATVCGLIWGRRWMRPGMLEPAEEEYMSSDNKTADAGATLAESLHQQVEALESQRADLLKLCREMVATLILDRNRPHIPEMLWHLGHRWSKELTRIVSLKANLPAPSVESEPAYEGDTVNFGHRDGAEGVTR